MNKKHVPAAAVGALLISLAGTVAAADSTITFKGSVDATTCTITGGTGTDGGVGDFTVTLPTVNMAELEVANAVAREIPFNIELSGVACSDGKTVRTKFNVADVNISANGNLKNKDGAPFAKNVEVQLLNSAGAIINLKSNANVLAAPIVGKRATLAHKVRYVAIGKAEAGQVETTVTYSIQYD